MVPLRVNLQTKWAPWLLLQNRHESLYRAREIVRAMSSLGIDRYDQNIVTDGEWYALAMGITLKLLRDRRAHVFFPRFETIGGS